MKKNRKKIIQSEDPFAICTVSVAPLRIKPFHDTEMVSQLLFGEMVEIIDQKNKYWFKVRSEWDKYEGWMDSTQIFRIPEKEYHKNIEKQAYALELVHAAMSSDAIIPICIGSTLVRFDGMSCRMPLAKMTYSGLAIFSKNIEMDALRLVKLAMKFLHAPYLWGGRSPFGIDGSGLVQMIFKLNGIRIPRDVQDQIYLGEIVDFPGDAKPADLAFFEDSKGNIIHVGMIMEENKILHSFGKVRIDYFDHQGIYNQELAKYTHRLRIIKRIYIENAQQAENKIIRHTKIK